MTLSGPAMAHETLRIGFGTAPRSEYVNGGCNFKTAVWVQEIGSSGVTRLRAKFELRNYYDPGIYMTSLLSTGWVYSTSFPDDSRSFYLKYFVAKFRYFSQNQYYIRGVFIGERPGFWRPDRKLTVRLGDVGCSMGGAARGPLLEGGQSASSRL